MLFSRPWNKFGDIVTGPLAYLVEGHLLIGALSTEHLAKHPCRFLSGDAVGCEIDALADEVVGVFNRVYGHARYIEDRHLIQLLGR